MILEEYKKYCKENFKDYYNEKVLHNFLVEYASKKDITLENVYNTLEKEYIPFLDPDGDYLFSNEVIKNVKNYFYFEILYLKSDSSISLTDRELRINKLFDSFLENRDLSNKENSEFNFNNLLEFATLFLYVENFKKAEECYEIAFTKVIENEFLNNVTKAIVAIEEENDDKYYSSIIKLGEDKNAEEYVYALQTLYEISNERFEEAYSYLSKIELRNLYLYYVVGYRYITTDFTNEISPYNEIINFDKSDFNQKKRSSARLFEILAFHFIFMNHAWEEFNLLVLDRLILNYDLTEIESIVCLALSETFLFTFSNVISLKKLEKYLFGTGRKKDFDGSNFFGELGKDSKDEFYRILNKFEDLNLIDRNFEDPDKVHIHEQLYILAISIMNKYFSTKDLAS
jgi:hypothetical protein